MSFRAQFVSRCDECGEAITPGQMIETAQTTGELLGLKRTYRHAEGRCPADQSAAIDRAREVLCPVCGMYHPGEC